MTRPRLRLWFGSCLRSIYACSISAPQCFALWIEWKSKETVLRFARVNNSARQLPTIGEAGTNQVTWTTRVYENKYESSTPQSSGQVVKRSTAADLDAEPRTFSRVAPFEPAIPFKLEGV